MPVTVDLPPVPSREIFAADAALIEQAIREGSDKAFIELCSELRRKYAKLAPLLSADLGTPTKKLTVVERVERRVLENAGVGADDIAALLRWLNDAIALLGNLRRARAA